jgi:hypothetical protein
MTRKLSLVVITIVISFVLLSCTQTDEIEHNNVPSCSIKL